MLVAIDPGLSTGMAFRFDNGQWGTITIPQMPDPADRLDNVLSMVVDKLQEGFRCQSIVIEAFVTMGYLSKYGIETIELIGALKAVCYLWKVQLVKQTPHQRLSMEPRAKGLLKERSIPHTDHEVSALAHLLTYESRLEGSVAPERTPTPMVRPSKITVKRVDA